MDLTAALTVYGPLGIGVLALGWAYWQERKGREADRRTYEQTVRELQEKRVEELKMALEATTTTTHTVNQAIAFIQSRGA